MSFLFMWGVLPQRAPAFTHLPLASASRFARKSRPMPRLAAPELLFVLSRVGCGRLVQAPDVRVCCTEVSLFRQRQDQ